MAVTANFGIKTDFDDAALKTLIEQLKSIPEHAKTISGMFRTVASEVVSGAERMSKAAIDADGKIVQSKEKVKGRTIADLHEELQLQSKTKKEIVALRDELAEQVSNTAKKLTMTLDAEEKKRLQNTQKELKSELAAVKEEAEKRGVESKKGMDREREFSGKGLAQVAGIGLAIEGTKQLIELTEEESRANSRLTAATGLQGEALKKATEDAEALGHQYKIGGDEGKLAMAAVGSFTHATGDQLKQQTEDAIILAQKMGTSTEAAAKLLGKAGDPEVAGNLKKLGINLAANATTEERAAAVHIAAMNAKDGVDRANDTATKNFNETLMEGKEIVAGYASTFLDILNPALKIVMPVLPELLLAIGAITIAMNAQAIAAKATAVWDGALAVATGIQTAATWALNAAMAVNPFVWIGLAVVALIAIIILLVKNWDKVIETTKKVFSAIMDAGGAVLSFLGITSKAEAATKKHTKSIDENKKSLEDIKKATDDAAKATADYTDSLKKNQEEQDKSAKEGQDNAIAAIVDIQQKLKTATGSEKAVLEERLQQWQSYGKKQVANAEAIETAKHAASLSIGAAADKEDQSGAKKAAKSKEDIAKESADSLLNAKKESIAAEKVSDAQKHVEEVNAEIAHAEALLKVALDFHGAKSSQYKSEENKLTTLRNTLQKDSRAALLDSMKSQADDSLALLEQKGIREGLTDRQINAERFAIEHTALQKEIDQRRAWGEDVSKLQLQLGTMELKNAAEIRRQKLEDDKQAQAVKLQLEKDSVDREKDGVQKEHDLADLKYRDELSALREQLENKKLTVAQYDALALAAQRKNVEESDAIDQKARDEKEQRAQQAFSDGIDFAQKSGAEQTKIAKDFLVKEVQQFISSQAAKIVAGNAAQTEQTALVAAGFVARQATYVAEGIASAASAAGTWIATAAKAVFNAFETMPFPLDIIAAVAAVGGVVELATQVPKLFGGHEMGTQSSSGGMKWVGERGPELMNVPHGAQVIPNHRIVNTGAQQVDLSPLISRLDSIHRATVQANSTFAKRPAPVLAVNSPFVSHFNIAVKNDDRSSI